MPCLICLRIMLSIPSKFLTKTPPLLPPYLSASEKEVRMVGGDDGGVPPPICLQIMLQMPLVHQLFANQAFSRTYLPPQSTHHFLFLNISTSGKISSWKVPVINRDAQAPIYKSSQVCVIGSPMCLSLRTK